MWADLKVFRLRPVDNLDCNSGEKGHRGESPRVRHAEDAVFIMLPEAGHKSQHEEPNQPQNMRAPAQFQVSVI